VRRQANIGMAEIAHPEKVTYLMANDAGSQVEALLRGEENRAAGSLAIAVARCANRMGVIFVMVVMGMTGRGLAFNGLLHPSL